MINNLPANYTKYAYLIVILVDGEFWFYGADNDFNRANEVARENNGMVVIMD
jgi:hypothetical protein